MLIYEPFQAKGPLLCYAPKQEALTRKSLLPERCDSRDDSKAEIEALLEDRAYAR